MKVSLTPPSIAHRLLGLEAIRSEEGMQPQSCDLRVALVSFHRLNSATSFTPFSRSQLSLLQAGPSDCAAST